MSEEEIIKENIIPVAIEDEMKNSYLTYAMSVIVSRALPDVRDGLKPVHRRVLHSMNEMGLHANKDFKKCARIVGDVLGKFHPHGDQSVYDALVRMAQSFSLRYPVVNGQGNFGSVDGDPPAAMRYTEAKLQKIAEEMLRDIKKDTVDFQLNYDDSMTEPTVLPAGFPFLLVNGTSGIAVGMATNMPPHNLTEVINATSAYIDNNDITIDELMEHVTGPDFPTGATIFGTTGIKQAYHTGKGKITVRANADLETTKSGRDVIIFTEIPYAVNKANLVAKIAHLINEKKIVGVSDLRDESDRNGMRIVLELKRGAIPNIVLNRLYAHTALQSNFNVNNLALVDGKPQLLNLKQLISYYVAHRKEVVIRRTQFDLKKAEDRAHILEGLKIALANIDDVIETIKKSSNVAEAKINLIAKFKFSEVQAQAILDMRLQKLTNLETQKILDELADLMKLIEYFKNLLSNEGKLMDVINTELIEVKEKFGNERQTNIVLSEINNIDIEDLITKEEVVVLISSRGYVKRVPVKAYKNQGRGGKGSSSAKLANEDFLEHLFIASTHDFILFVSSEGKAYYLKVHEIPEASRTAKGSHIKSLISISANEDISAVVSLKEFNDQSFIVMGTRKGVVKKVKTSQFINAKKRGIVAINLDVGDRLMSAELTDGNNDLFMISRKGQVLRYSETNIRAMGRSSRGVRGINLSNSDELIAVLSRREDELMLLISEFGYGKRTDFDNISPHGRGTKGQIGYKVSEKTGEIIGAVAIKDGEDILCITSKGSAIKTTASGISVMGRTAMGVRIVNINKPDFLIGIARVVNSEEDSVEE